MDIEPIPFVSREAFDRVRNESDKPTFHPWDDDPVKGNIMSDTEETPAETIERLERLNNRLAQMVKRGSDRLQESDRELMAQGWERGVLDAYGPVLNRHNLPPNPYRQPIDLMGGVL